jgi:hypothetical protein
MNECAKSLKLKSANTQLAKTINYYIKTMQ